MRVERAHAFKWRDVFFGFGFGVGGGHVGGRALCVICLTGGGGVISVVISL